MAPKGDMDVTCDAFLGGQLHLYQPKSGYRAGVDPVLLASSVQARPGDKVLDLGCGVGAAGLCLARRVPSIALWGVELQSEYAELADRNGKTNGLDFHVVNADLNDLPEPVRSARYDHVIANPPYYSTGTHSIARDTGRGVAMSEIRTPLQDWVAVAARRLAPKGYLHVIQRIDRLPELIAGCEGRLGSIEVLPIAARSGRRPDRMILKARKEGRAPFVLHASVVMHEGEKHQNDQESYNREIMAVLRDAKALKWPSSGKTSRG